jgi:Flp pilus assembly protein TadB
LTLCVCLCDCGNGGGWITGAAHRKRKRAQTDKSKKINKNETAIHHEFKVREPRGLVTTTTTNNQQQQKMRNVWRVWLLAICVVVVAWCCW